MFLYKQLQLWNYSKRKKYFSLSNNLIILFLKFILIKQETLCNYNLDCVFFSSYKDIYSEFTFEIQLDHNAYMSAVSLIYFKGIFTYSIKYLVVNFLYFHFSPWWGDTVDTDLMNLHSNHGANMVRHFWE